MKTTSADDVVSDQIGFYEFISFLNEVIFIKWVSFLKEKDNVERIIPAITKIKIFSAISNINILNLFLKFRRVGNIGNTKKSKIISEIWVSF